MPQIYITAQFGEEILGTPPIYGSNGKKGALLFKAASSKLSPNTVRCPRKASPLTLSLFESPRNMQMLRPIRSIRLSVVRNVELETELTEDKIPPSTQVWY